MDGILVQTTLHGKEDLNKIVESLVIGKDSNPLGSQTPRFKGHPLSFCSYLCAGYKETYGDREGIMFETDVPVAYACPVDTLDLMRAGNWIPGHEKFIFSSLGEMLNKYPTSEDFKKDFKEFFKKLDPFEVYPDNSRQFAESNFETDYCLDRRWNPGCNEVTFPKPLKIKSCEIFNSKEDLSF